MATFLEPVELEEIEETTDAPGDTAQEPLFNVVLLNDDHHTDAYVVEMLGQLFCVPPVRAFRHAVEVDTTGRSIVMTCELSQAQYGRDQIHSFGRDRRIKSCAGSMSAIVEPAGPPS